MGVVGFRYHEAAVTHAHIPLDASLLVGMEQFVVFQTNEKRTVRNLNRKKHHHMGSASVFSHYTSCHLCVFVKKDFYW